MPDDMQNNSRLDSEQRSAAFLLRYHSYVFRQARRFAPMPDIAEDIAQQVLTDFLSKADRWKLDGDPRPLLLTMSQRSAADIWRKQAKILPESLRKIAEYVQREFEDAPDVECEEALEIAALRHCMQKLPEEGRKLVTLYYFEDVSTKDLAEQLQKKCNTIAKAIFRLREKLRTCIEQTLKKGAVDDA